MRQWFDDHDGVPNEGGRRWKGISTSNTSEKHHLFVLWSFVSSTTLKSKLHKGGRYLHVKTTRGHHKKMSSHVNTSDCYGKCAIHVVTIAKAKGDIIEPVRLLFTFQMQWPSNLCSTRIECKNVRHQNPGKGYRRKVLFGDTLGMSGPYHFKASAWGAVPLAKWITGLTDEVDWIPKIQMQEIEQLQYSFQENSGNFIALWCDTASFLEISNGLCSDSIDKNYASLHEGWNTNYRFSVKKCPFHVDGKATFKAEFVTAGGVEQDSHKSISKPSKASATKTSILREKCSTSMRWREAISGSLDRCHHVL